MNIKTTQKAKRRQFKKYMCSSAEVCTCPLPCATVQCLSQAARQAVAVTYGRDDWQVQQTGNCLQ